MRRPVVGAAIGLDLDDPALASSGLVLAYQAGAKKDASRLGSDAREVGWVQDAQAGRLP